VEISFSKTKSFAYNPGQYVYLFIPELSVFQDRDKGDGIAEETNDGLLNDDEVDGQAKTDSH